MKKTYIAPTAVQINFVTEGMMAQSIGYSNTETVTNEADVLSNGKGWSSDNWTAADED